MKFRAIKKKSAVIWPAFLMLLTLTSMATATDGDIVFDPSHPSPRTLNPGEEAFLRIDVTFSDANFDSLFLFIPNKPKFFTHWSDRRKPGPIDVIHDKIVFKPELDDGGQYFFQIIAGGIRPDGTVVADTMDSEIRITPFILQEPEFTGGTLNTIKWMKFQDLFDQHVNLVDPTTGGLSQGRGGFGKGNYFSFDTFENLQHGVRYGYFVKGFTEDSTEVLSDTVYSVQDAMPPEFLTTSRGMTGPDGTIDLFWTTVTDMTSPVIGFVIFRRTDTSSFTAIDTVFTKTGAPDEAFHFQDEREWGLVEGETYFYKVVAFDTGFNVGDGLQLGPFIPDATIPPPPLFDWRVGFGFDFVPPPPHAPFPQQSDRELPWHKQGTSNTVHLFNPEGAPGFEGLARADSVRFQAVRDKSKFFDREWQPGVQFFDSWMSPWIAIDDFNGDLLSYFFDFTNGGQNDEWFIHGHFFKYRAQFRDAAKNESEWSRLNTEDRFVAAFQDVFPPGDISNLNVFVEFDQTVPGGGFLRVDWEGAVDSVSGVKSYDIYRKIGPDGQFEMAGTVPHSDDPVLQFRDSFEDIGKSTQIFYRISSTDNVGNANDFRDSQREASARAPIPPMIFFEDQHTDINGTLFTPDEIVQVCWVEFDLFEVARMFLTVNGVEEEVDPRAKVADVTLKEGPNEIFAHVIFTDGGRSGDSNILMINRDSTAPTPIANLVVANDPSFRGNMFLEWTASTDQLLVTYDIQRRELGSGDFVSIGSTAALRFTDPYRQPGGGVLKEFQHYEYRIRPTDQLGNTSEASAAIGENYCNIPPIIVNVSFGDDSVTVQWIPLEFPDQNAVPLNQTRFDVKLFRDELPADLDNTPAFRQEFIVGGDQVKLPVDAGPKYHAVVRAVELQSGNLDSSEWSESRLSDTGQSIIPPNVTLETQAQPTDTSGIFVSWGDYFEQDPAFWAVNDRGIIGFYQVKRWPTNDPANVLERTFNPGDPVFNNRMFMDRQDLEPKVEYTYQVIPFERKTNDPPRLLPAGNDDAATLNARSMVVNFIDRVFIPKFNGLHPVNPATGKKYFSLLDADELMMEWFWLFQENGTERPADPGDFRGAAKLQIFAANNDEFLNRPDFKQFNRILELDRNNLTSDAEFSNISLGDLVNPDEFNIFEGKTVFAKIMAFDKFGNSPSYPSSAAFDGVTEFVLDNTLPTATSLSFKITSSTDTTSNKTLVDIAFSWPKSVDALSGLRDYTIKIFQMIGDADSVISEITDIPAADTTFTLEKFEIQDQYFEQPLFFQICPRDFAGNVNRNGDITEFKFFSPPELLSVERDTVTNTVIAKWTKVPAADKYFIVFANDKSFFLDPGLRTNPGNSEVVVAEVSDPDTITKVIARIFNPDVEVFFRMIASKSDIFESGWSNFVTLPKTGQSGGSGSISTHVGDGFMKVPTAYSLRQNYPNPFNPETRISYELPVQSQVEITIYNLAGSKVKTLVNGENGPGFHEVSWDGRDSDNQVVASGMYLYMISTPEFQQVKKCLFLK